MRGKTRLLLLTLPALALVLTVAFILFRAQQTLSRATRDTQAGQQIPFSLRTLDLAARPPLAFEPMAAADAYATGAWFEGARYLAGPAGLTIQSTDGSPERTLRTGIELPIAPIVAIASGRLRGASERQLLLATAGAGLLILTPEPHALPRLKQLLPANAADADLTTLAADASGDLLLGTHRHGVLRFDGASLAPYRFTFSGVDPARLEVTALAVSEASSVLIGTRTQGLFYAHAGTIRHADTASGLPDPQVETILVQQGHAFAGTPLGVAEFDLLQSSGNASALHPDRILAQGIFAHALALNSAGTQLMIGTLDQGIQPVFLAGAAHFRPVAIGIHDMSPVADGTRIDALIANPGGGFEIIANGAVDHSSSSDRLADRNISALTFDSSGRLYVGFFDRGLDIVTLGSEPSVRHLEDDHLFCVNRLALDPRRHTVAAATANGLVLFDEQGTARQVLTRRDGVLSDHITDVAFTQSGTVLATPSGVSYITPTGVESLYAFQGLVNNHVYALAANPVSGTVLAGTLGGLSQLEQGSVRRNWTVANSSLGHNWVTALAPMPGGSYLVGTYGAGVMQLSAAGDFSKLDLPASLPHDLVINSNALLVTHDHVFAGTLGHGLLVYTVASGRWTSVTNGLPSLNVTAFAAHAGELYIGTENGLVHIAEAAL